MVRDNQFHLAASTSGTDRYLIYLQSNIIYYYDGDTTELNFSSTAAFNDNPGTFMFAFDADNQKLYFGKDGSWTNGASGISGGNPSIGSGPLLDGFNAGETYFPWCTPYTSGQNMGANFGQKPFKFPPPAGFQPLNAANARPVKVFARPDQYVGVTTYAGDGTSVVVSDYQFKPDFVWIKGYTDPDRHGLYDTVRGATKRLQSNETNAEDTQNGVMSFDDKGFSVGNYAETNGSGRGYVAWSWKAGGNKNTFNVDDVGYASASAAGLDGGSTNPTGASVNTESKFGIYIFDGNSSNRTLSHGLGQQPDFTIVKKKSTSGNSWVVWHKSIANNKYLILNANNNQDTDATLFNSHASDSSTLWTLGSNTSINETGQSSVAYLWCDVPGMQKFGSYVGNGDNDGTYIELGFAPKILLTKSSSHGSDWQLWIHHDNLIM